MVPLARRPPSLRRPPPIAATDANRGAVWRRFVRWRQARAAAGASSDGAPTPSPPPPPRSSSSRRGAVVDPSGTDYFLGPGVAATPPTPSRQQSTDKEAERHLYRQVEGAPTPAEAVARCLAALGGAQSADDEQPSAVGVEPLCLALFRGAVAVSDGEAITEDADGDAQALRRLQCALAAVLGATTATTTTTTITPSDAANVLWALGSESCSPSAAARGSPAAEAETIEALAAAVLARRDLEEQKDDDGNDDEQHHHQGCWQTADLVSALWGAGTLLRALGLPMPSTQSLVRALGGALARRWDFGGAAESRPASPSQPQYPLPAPRPRPCAEDLADASAGVAAAAAAATTASGEEEKDAEPLLQLLESVSASLHAALCNRHSGGAFGGSGGAAPGAADTAKLFSSLASAALLLSQNTRGGWRAAVPSLPRALDALAALASQRARDRHRQMLSRPAHLAAAAKALADLGHGSLAVPELLRLLGREAALGAAGADGLAPPARALTLAERQAIKAAALLSNGGGGTGASSSSSSSDEEDEQQHQQQQMSLPPDVAPPTARWRAREAADLLSALLRLGYQPPRLMCSALAAAVLKGLREGDLGEEEDEGAGAAVALLAAFADAGSHPGDELAERLFSMGLGGNNTCSSNNERLADLLHAWAVLMAGSSSSPADESSSQSKGHAAARQAAEALCSSAVASLPARSAVRALWSMAALGLLTRERFGVLAERALGGAGGGGGAAAAAAAAAAARALSDAQLAAVAEAAVLAGAKSLLSPADLNRCERALAGERAEAVHRASRLSSFARDADALDAALAAQSQRGWRRLERDLAAWAREDGEGGNEQDPPVLLLLADEEGGSADDEAGASALDHRAGGGLLRGSGPLGGLVLRARLARQEAFGEDGLSSSSSATRVLILPRRQAAMAADERLLLSRALPLLPLSSSPPSSP